MKDITYKLLNNKRKSREYEKRQVFLAAKQKKNYKKIFFVSIKKLNNGLHKKLKYTIKHHHFNTNLIFFLFMLNFFI